MLRRVELAPRNLFLRNPCQMRLLYVTRVLGTYAAKRGLLGKALRIVDWLIGITERAQLTTGNAI